MSKTLEPVGYQWLDTGHFRKKIPSGCDESAFRALVTTDQAEAYAVAKVQEALEEAAEIADRHNAFATYDAIRALIPKEPT